MLSLPAQAPEVFKDDSKHDCKSDCWSLGVLTYELIVGSPKVLSGSETGSRDGPAKNADKKLDGDIKAFAARCLQLNPADRAPMSELVQDKWFTDNYDVAKFKTLDVEPPWKPEENKAYFKQASNEMEDAFGAPAPKKVGPNTDPVFNNYEYNCEVSAEDAEAK